MKSFPLSSRRCLAVLAAPLCQKRGAIHPAAKPAGRLHFYATSLYIISNETRRSPLVTFFFEIFFRLDFWGGTAFIQAEVPFSLYTGGSFLQPL